MILKMHLKMQHTFGSVLKITVKPLVALIT
jgi:hypothetical protein